VNTVTRRSRAEACARGPGSSLAVANTVFHPPIAIPGPCMWCLARFAVHTLLHGTSSVHFPFPQPHACAAAALEVLHAPRLVSSSLARPSATCVRTRLRGHLQTCGAAPCRILCPVRRATTPSPTLRPLACAQPCRTRNGAFAQGDNQAFTSCSPSSTLSAALRLPITAASSGRSPNVDG